MEFEVGDLAVIKENLGWGEQLYGLVGEIKTADEHRDGSIDYVVDFGGEQGEILMYEGELDRY